MPERNMKQMQTVSTKGLWKEPIELLRTQNPAALIVLKVMVTASYQESLPNISTTTCRAEMPR